MDCRGNRKLTVAENVRLQDSIHRHDFPGIIMSLPILEMFRRRARNRRKSAMSKIQWDSQLYLRYERERTQPSIDLASRIDLDSPATIINLGCGPENSTRVLRERWPTAHIMVLDSSTTMIEKARQNSDAIDWRIGDIQTWYEPNRFDLIFANASLHWIDDHA